MISMLLLCACGKNSEVWETDGTGLVQMEVPEDAVESAENGGKTVEKDGEAAASSGKTTIYVYICGAVVTPDVYALPEGSRMYEAVELAGGLAEDADADQVNLAVALSDGQKVRIPRKGEKLSEAQMLSDGNAGIYGGSYGAESSGNGASGGNGSAAGSSGAGTGLVNINTAGKEALMTLNGIGSTRAEAIIQYREAHGAFQSPRDLLKVNGIKEKTYEKIRGQISIE